ncbi:hypothetical protein PYW07_017190 [Mythimna separata]|uniref:Reverse transcriptase n=1 Tax=Mythimna separata TaxID=271217 RepID=A0AAD7YUW1_MYTSE|nr:hypothetical protein PYW07_017190 [Mythimna separata]
MSLPSCSTCPHCPGCSRVFSAHGLKVHIGRMHKHAQRSGAVPQISPVVSVHASSSTQESPAHPPARNPLDRLAACKAGIPVLRHIPKGARNQAAGKLCDIIDSCVSTNGVDEWSALLSFAYSALRVPAKELPGNMTAKVRTNIMVNDCFDSKLGVSRRLGSRSFKKSIETKVFEGDLRGAVRLLMSDDSFAGGDADTLASMKHKHPDPSRPLSFPPDPDPSFTALSVTVEDVVWALSSFYTGSAAGLDGIRPGHLKELTSMSAGENGRRLVGSLTRLANFMLSGQMNPCVCPFLYGASLFALKKKDGGIRPIAVGSVFRRLTAKLACRAVKEEMSRYLQPHQLGFGTRLGCEAAIHATRAFVTDPESEDSIVLKLDIRNAFNTLERDVLLSEVLSDITNSKY